MVILISIRRQIKYYELNNFMRIYEIIPEGYIGRQSAISRKNNVPKRKKQAIEKK
jgi:hypothetical protein